MYGQNVFLFITGCSDGFGMVGGSCIGKYFIVCYVYDSFCNIKYHRNAPVKENVLLLSKPLHILLLATLMVISVASSKSCHIAMTECI